MTAGAVGVSALALGAAIVTDLPWLRFLDYGDDDARLYGLTVAAGTAAFDWLKGTRGGPDITSIISARRFAIGALLMQAIIYGAVHFGL